MKRTAIALTLILALLLLLLAETLFINLAKANPFPTYPVISIESPTNKTYTANSLFLNVTLVTQWDGLYFTSERRLVSYCIDAKESIPITQTEYRFDSEKQASILSGSAVLADLTEGTHNLRVNAEYHYDNGKQVFVSNSNVNFTIDPTYSPSLSPSPSPSPTRFASAMVPAKTDNGATVDLTIRGNITSSQMSNVTIATTQYHSSATVSFTVTGESGTTGFCNMTIPKSAIILATYGTMLDILIDSQPAQDQGYTQDANNYYVWYTISFSTHEVLILFMAMPSTGSALPWYLNPVIYLIVATVVILVLVAVGFVLRTSKKHKRSLVAV